MKPEKPVQVSLIICTRNRAEKLRTCLASIRPVDDSELSLEIVLVNNDCSDHTGEVMRAFREESPFPVEIVEEPNQGLGIARNAGLAYARGRILAFTDDDCLLTPGYLTTVAGVFDSGRFHYCGGRILRYDPSDSPYACLESEESKLFPPYHALEPGAIQGANMIFHRDVVTRIGLFDPIFGPGADFRCEDIDYCARASFAGFAGAYVPELVVYHHHGRKPGKDIDDLERTNAYARGAYYAKFILKGRRVGTKASFAKSWMQLRFIKERNPSKFARELKGAWQYTLHHPDSGSQANEWIDQDPKEGK